MLLAVKEGERAVSEPLSRRSPSVDSQRAVQVNHDQLGRAQQLALKRIHAVWNERPRDVPKAERAVAQTMVEHRIPIEHVCAATELPYARVVRMLKRVTGKMPTALAITEARRNDLITQSEMITLLSNREYDPAVSQGGRSAESGDEAIDLRRHPNSVSVLQQAYLRGLVTQGELWSIGDSIKVRDARG